MSTKKQKTPDMPSDPDPVPMASTASSAEDEQIVKRQIRKKAASAYGRSQSIIASDLSGSANAAGQTKKVLGG